MTVSPFTPLFFINRKADGIDSGYLQVFSTNDLITIEIICKADEVPMLWLIDEENGDRFERSEFKAWHMNSGVVVYCAQFTLPKGCYSVEIVDYGKSEPFMVTDDETVLSKTTLIQYTMKDNRQRLDAVFKADDGRIVFDFRVHGGFKDEDWSFSVDSEQYTDEYSDIVQLYGLESTQKRFTMGESDGVPIWYGEFLNRILVCNYVYFDGVQYVRKETNVPEASQTMDGVNSFTFRQTLQKAIAFENEVDTEVRLAIRREDGMDNYRITENEQTRVTAY